MIIEVKNEERIILGYIIEEDEEGDDPMGEDSRVITQAIIEEERERAAESISLPWPEVR